jgi:hypothetical protein
LGFCMPETVKGCFYMARLPGAVYRRAVKARLRGPAGRLVAVVAIIPGPVLRFGAVWLHGRGERLDAWTSAGPGAGCSIYQPGPGPRRRDAWTTAAPAGSAGPALPCLTFAITCFIASLFTTAGGLFCMLQRPYPHVTNPSLVQCAVEFCQGDAPAYAKLKKTK